jgi:two-component system phosphate regulon sensor histidine kinase PhoR
MSWRTGSCKAATIRSEQQLRCAAGATGRNESLPPGGSLSSVSAGSRKLRRVCDESRGWSRRAWQSKWKVDATVRRDTIILTLAAMLTLCGVAVAGAEGAVRSPGLGAHERLALGLLAAAAATGVAGQLLSRRAIAAFARQVRAAAGDPSCRIECRAATTAPLAAALNDMVEGAGRSVERAAVAVKELEIQLKLATAEREHAEAIIYSISDAVLVTDPYDELLLANESAARTFGFDLAAVERAGRPPVDQVLHDPRMIELIRDMRQSDNVGCRRIVEHPVRTPAGPRVFNVTLSCVAGPASEAPANDAARSTTAHERADSGANNHNSGVVAVLHDVTREKEIAELKNDFVSSVSHELRTPLASIRAYVEMLIDGEADSERTRRDFYDVIQNEAVRLGRLIDNILNISRLESGLMKVNRQPISLAVVVKEAAEVILPQAKQKQIELVEKLTPIFYQTLADRDMLYQAVLNLLSNAVKYTPEGGTITVNTEVDEAANRVTLRVCDTGVGIPPKDLPFVFDKFYRAEANNHMANGTGLGLSLVKHIVEVVHGGHLVIESTVGKGSCFGFELDLCE